MIGSFVQPKTISDYVVIVDGYGASITVEHGHLIVRSGSFGSDPAAPTKMLSRGRSRLSRLIVRAPAGNISLSALDWCNRMGATVAILGSDSRLINCLVPDQPHDAPIKRAQAIAGVTEDAIRLSQWLLTKKFESQLRAVEVEFSRLGVLVDREGEQRKAVADLRGCLVALPQDRSLVALLSREGVAAQAYWRCLAGTALPWPDWTKKRIPEHWLRVWPRQTGLKALVRDATDPFNAILNYGYTLLEVETRVACAAYGLDPDLGLHHVDDRLRESFIYDLIEPQRSTVDVLALEFVKRQGLRPYMFIELRNGVVRLDPDFARDFARQVMAKLRRPSEELASQFTTQLRYVKVAYKLERATRLRALADTSRTSHPNCEYCKQPLTKRGLKFCNRHCYLRHSVEVRQPLKLAQLRLAELRAQGISPGHGGEAARKRSAAISVSNRRRRGEKRAIKRLDMRCPADGQPHSCFRKADGA